MTKKTCQNCEQDIGHLEESYSYNGHVVCKACMIRLEKQFQDSEITNSNIETKTPIEEIRTEQHKDMKCQTPPAEMQAAALKKEIEYLEDERTSKKCKVSLIKEAAYLPSAKQENLIQTSEFAERSPTKKRGYILKHWHGELSLAVSFWINLFLFNFVLRLVDVLFAEIIVCFRQA